MKKIILASVAAICFAVPAFAFDANGGIVGGISGTSIAGGSSASSKNGGAASSGTSASVSTVSTTKLTNGQIQQSGSTYGSANSDAGTIGGKGNKASAGTSFDGGTTQFGLGANVQVNQHNHR